jgi:acyl-CoA thioester hydrolase
MSSPAIAYAFEATAGPEHIDELGHVNHKVYIAWAEEAGVRHWRSLATPEEQARWVWVAARLEIDFRAETKAGETLVVETWVGVPQGARFDRFVRIRGRDGGVKAEAKTTWALIDAARRRPARVPEDLAARFR